MSKERSDRSTLPEWISGSRIDGAYIDQLQDALSIAWEALDQEFPSPRLAEAMRRIEDLGK